MKPPHQNEIKVTFPKMNQINNNNVNMLDIIVSVFCILSIIAVIRSYPINVDLKVDLKIEIVELIRQVNHHIHIHIHTYIRDDWNKYIHI